jgi:hypothetical protein
MQYIESLNTHGSINHRTDTAQTESKLAYFRIWMAVFRLFRSHFGLLLMAMLFLASPSFILNGLLHAHDMMTKGSAALTQSEIPVEQLRVLWLSLVCGDVLGFVALAVFTLVIFKYLHREGPTGFTRSALKTLGQLGISLSFWLFFVVQIVVFAMINSPDGGAKIGGMLLYAVSILLLLASLDRNAPLRGTRLRQMTWLGWLNLVFILITFPILFILLNGIADYLLLVLMDMGAARLLDYFEPNSPVLPFGAIALTKFISQWFNLLTMALLLCTYDAMRGSPLKLRPGGS